MHNLSRRQFLVRGSVAGAALTVAPSLLASDASNVAGANEKIVAAVMGANNRGLDHIKALLAIPNVEIAYVCDVEDGALARGMQALSEQQPSTKAIKDIRRALDDKAVDIVAIAAPNHWHAPATILACAAGKHVYVEKPGSHTPQEAELIVQAARKHNRMVQMGNQRRSFPWVIEAIERLKAGEIGEVNFARTWYTAGRKSIGKGSQAPVPKELEWDLWQGPAPERPYVDNLVHYNWHWRWHWGGGELINNGVHSLDLARWGLGVDLPTRVTCNGGKYIMPADDDQETPDTIIATYDFAGGKGITWDGHSCHPRGFEGSSFGVNFYGSNGHLIISGTSVKILDLKGKTLHELKGKPSNIVHFENLIDSIRNGTAPAAEVEDAQKSTMLCHLGNIAYRTASTVHFNPDRARIIDNPAAMQFWTREYRKGWEPRV